MTLFSLKFVIAAELSMRAPWRRDRSMSGIEMSDHRSYLSQGVQTNAKSWQGGAGLVWIAF